MRAAEILGRRSLQQTVNNLSLSISLRKTEAKKRDIAPRTQLEEWQELTKKKKASSWLNHRVQQAFGMH